jgi:tRNA pseudouridine38-40 synthase
VLASKDRSLAAPAFSAAGLYFVGPYYDPVHAIAQQTPAMTWLP